MTSVRPLVRPLVADLVRVWGDVGEPEPLPPLSVWQAVTGVDTTVNTSASFVLPTTHVSACGFIILKTGAAVTISAVPAGWELVFEDVSVPTGFRVYKKTTPFGGTEGGTTLTWTLSGSATAAFAFIEVANSFNQCDAAYAASLNPPSVSPVGGSAETVFFAVSSCRRTDNDVSAAPTNYTAAVPLYNETAAASTSSGHVALAAAYRILTAASEDPGDFTWTGTLTTDPSSVLVAIR